MNKIVREHYPVSSLPDDLRGKFDGNAMVRVVIEWEDSPESLKEDVLLLPPFEYREPGPPMKVADLLESIRVYKATHAPSTDPEEAVRRIRELRDEWDDE